MGMYELLVEYKKKYNTVCIPKVCEEEPVLARWTSNQRQRCYLKHRVELLNKLGFVWDAHEYNWRFMYDRLVEYKAKYKNTRFPTRFKQDVQLRRWVLNQQSVCKNPYRVELLNRIGFEWKDDGNARWMEMYELLVEHKKKYNTVCIPKECEEEPGLARWTSNQRRYCKLKDRVELLNKLGFVWDALEYKWMVMYDRLVKYKAKYKNTRVPKRFKQDIQLGTWVSNQRSVCENTYRVELLNRIGFEWKIERVFQNLVNLTQQQREALLRLHTSSH